jgi:phosphoglycerate-specific signal transduction histidine kinase
MNTSNKQILHDEELAFFAKIMASISHELNNVLSIINEYSGLLADLVDAEENGIPFEKNKIDKIAQNIKDQIKREQEIIKLLNRFAHRLDTPLLEFNLNDLAYDIIRLSQRFAALKKVSLEFIPPQEQILITNDPFRVQHVVFSCLQLVLDDSNTNDSISISLEKTKTYGIFKISSKSGYETENRPIKWELILSLVNNVHGIIRDEYNGDNCKIINLYIPLFISDHIR